jgi:hypothetical protein
LIASSDPNDEDMNYGLGFQDSGCSARGGTGSYRGTSILDSQIKLTLSNSVDLIFKAVENLPLKEELTFGAHWPTGLQVGLAGLTC